jgi:flagellin-specific chaperone FliS
MELPPFSPATAIVLLNSLLQENESYEENKRECLLKFFVQERITEITVLDLKDKPKVKEALDGLNHQKSNLTNRNAWEQLARLRDMEKFLENLQSVYDSVHAKTRFFYKEQIYLVRNGPEDSVSAVKVLKQMGIRIRHHHFN